MKSSAFSYCCVCLLIAASVQQAWCMPNDPKDKKATNGDDSKFVVLFDGKTLDGWEVSPAEGTDRQWRVEDGNIITENKGGKGSNLWTKKDYRDYELELEFKTLSDDYDTGVFLRGDGHQVQIGISGSLKKDMTACIYAPWDKKGGYPGKTDKVAAVNKVGQWNHLRIVLKGKRIQTFLNGKAMVDYEGIAIKDKGPIGLQLHGGRHMKVAFRNIQVRER
jgi:hypothetical protein